jgi:hypothetical protein
MSLPPEIEALWAHFAPLCRRQHVAMICRLRLDAGLDDPPPAPVQGKRGPKAKKGARQLKLSERARRADTPWQEHELEWYGGQRKSLRLFSLGALTRQQRTSCVVRTRRRRIRG